MRLTHPAVSARAVVLGYPAKVAVAESSFSIPWGRVTAVIGPNGSGKSTLLNSMAGLAAPLSGEIEAPTDRIAYVLQTTKVNEALPISVAEVVTMGRYASRGWHRRLRPEDRAIVAEAMERLAISDLAGEQLHQLSGGQRQRAYVAQGLAQDHDILLLDEPMSGVDLTTARAIDDIVHDEAEAGKAVVMTTHDLSEARVADYVILLAGKVVAAGTPAEVLTAEHLNAAYGTSLLHLDRGRIFIDDAAHQPVEGWHSHRPPG